MSVHDVHNFVKMVRRKTEEGENYEDLKKLYYSFYVEYPTLFDKAADVKFPLTYLDMMVKWANDLNKEKPSKEKIEEYDKKIYDVLRKEYIDKKLNHDEEPV